MKRCYLHIGMPKTGSTSIQKNLSEVSNPSGWSLLTVGGSPNMGPALYTMFSQKKIHHTLLKRGKSPDQVAKKGEALREKLAAVIRKSNHETIIISAEAMVGLNKDSIAALRDFLKPLCDEIRVIGYVRPPMGYKTSVFQQKVKVHAKNTFDVGVPMDYAKKFGKFDEVFGTQNVILRKFDPAAFPNKCIVADFCLQLGIEAPDPSVIRRANQSLTREACGVLFAYRKFGPGYGVGKTVLKENQMMLAALRAMGGSKFKVARSILEPSVLKEEKDLKWMEKRLGISLREEIADDGTEVGSEEDLLTISRATCIEFVTKISGLHKITVPEAMIPTADPVPPQAVADLVEYCRSQIKAKILEKMPKEPDAPQPTATKKPKSAKKRRCFIHVGMLKTGSSSIQSNLAKMEKTPGWKMMKVGGKANMGPTLFAMFSSKIHHTFVKRGMTPEQVAEKGALLRGKMAAAIAKSKKKTIIISGEAMAGMKEDGVAALRNFLLPLFDEVKVIGYVRPPMGYKMSTFQQNVKTSGTDNLAAITAKMNYREKFEKFDNVFGQENVILRKFDPSTFPNKCIVSDFCSQLRIKGPDPSTIRRVNESMSREACGILFAYRKFGPGFGVGKTVIRENHMIVSPLVAMKGDKFKVSNSLLAPGLAKEESDLTWMENRLGVSLRESIAEDGTEVASEEDLLRISRAACEQYVVKFNEAHGPGLPEIVVPPGDPVAPQQVAVMVEFCRDVVRGLIQGKKSQVPGNDS